jgi:hypothetical protein
MKMLVLLLIAIGGLLSACVAYEVPNRDRGAYDREHDGAANRMDRDRDREGEGDAVPNREDRREYDRRRD